MVRAGREEIGPEEDGPGRSGPGRDETGECRMHSPVSDSVGEVTARRISRLTRTDRSEGALTGDRGVQLTQPVGVLVGVVAAEEKLSSGREHGTYPSAGSAPIAAIGSRQLGTGQCSGHDSSVLAFRLNASRLGLVRRVDVARWIYSVRRLGFTPCSPIRMSPLSRRSNTAGQQVFPPACSRSAEVSRDAGSGAPRG